MPKACSSSASDNDDWSQQKKIKQLTTMPSISGVTITWQPSRDLRRRSLYGTQKNTTIQKMGQDRREKNGGLASDARASSQASDALRMHQNRKKLLSEVRIRAENHRPPTSRTNEQKELKDRLRHAPTHVSVSPKARSSMSSSSSLASGSSSKTSPDKMMWHVEHAHTPSQAPANECRAVRGDFDRHRKCHAERADEWRHCG